MQANISPKMKWILYATAAAGVAILCYQTFSTIWYPTAQSLKDKFESLHNLRVARLNHLREIELNVERAIRYNPEITKAAASLDRAFRSGEASYKKIHEQKHPSFQKLISEGPISDLYLINAKGDVVYSVQKDFYFGKNLRGKDFIGDAITLIYQKFLNSQLSTDENDVVNSDSTLGEYPTFYRAKVIGSSRNSLMLIVLKLIPTIKEFQNSDVQFENEVISAVIDRSELNRAVNERSFPLVSKHETTELKSILQKIKWSPRDFPAGIEEKNGVLILETPITSLNGGSNIIVSLIPKEKLFISLYDSTRKIALFGFLIFGIFFFLQKISSAQTSDSIRSFGRAFGEIKSGKIEKLNVNKISVEFRVAAQKYNEIIDSLQETIKMRRFVESIFGSLTEMLFVVKVKEEPISGEIILEVASINSSTKKALNSRSSEILGKNLLDFLHLEQFVKEHRIEILESKCNDRLETTMVSEVWEKLPISVGVSSLFDSVTRESYLIITAQDISEQKRIVTSLNVEKSKAVASTKAKSEFLSNVSHELRTPLNGLIGGLQILRESEVTSEQMALIQSAEKSAESIRKMLSDVLDYDLLSSGKLKINNQLECNLPELLNEVLVTFNDEIKWDKIQVSVDLDNGVDGTFYGDRIKIQQVLTRLISNAIKFTPQGAIALKVRSVESSDASALVEFSVCDTGIGVTKEFQGKLFKVFEQGDAGSSKEEMYRGLGLGLALCRKIVSQMGGTINYRPAEGGGSVFTFSLRLQYAEREKKQNLFENQRVKRILVLGTDKNLIRVLTDKRDRFQIETKFLPLADIDSLNKGELDFSSDGIICINPDWANPIVGMNLKAILKKHGHSKIIVFNGLGHVERVDLCPMEFRLFRRTTLSLIPDINLMEIILEMSKIVAPKDSVDHRVKILCVDDGADNRKIMEMFLKKFTENMDFAENGIEAVKLYKTNNYNLVLMDIQMPEKDGYQATKEIREIEREEQRTPAKIIAVTGNTTSDDIARCLQSGCDEHIAKPLRKDDFKRIVSKAALGF